VGYGKNPPNPQWPGDARVALNFNLNYETGGEANILTGDPASEGMLNDIGFPPVPGKRNPLVESAFEYGSRVGVWRVLRIFAKFDIPLSILGVATALEHNPEVTHACVESGHEIVSHGYRWIDYHHIDEEVEREHIRRAVETIERLAGTRPVGWMTPDGLGRTRGGCSSKQVVFSMIGMRSTTNSLTGSRSPDSRISLFPTPMKLTTTAATRATASHTLMIFIGTCGMPSTSSMKRAPSTPS
jgi:peptidoglycan/xylan/chitin deacetylase (PgdA/CDA1 family)